MALAPKSLNTFAGRLATFEPNRTSTARKKAVASWPHKTPTPDQLARAGFYYKASSANTDSVTCFLCNKALDGWEPEDNPALEHLLHVPHCAWAINVCIEQRSNDMDRAEEDPLSEKMLQCRRETFRDLWPHENKKGFRAKTEKMVASGWVYNPLPEADDCVSCFYCGVSLDGWEPKDDPWAEHQRRAPECHFFTLIEETRKTRPTTKVRRTRVSKTKRSPRQSAVPMLEAVSFSDEAGAAFVDNAMSIDTVQIASDATVSRQSSVKQRTTSKTKRALPKEEEQTSVVDKVAEQEETASAAKTEDSNLRVSEKQPKGRKPSKRVTSRKITSSQQIKGNVLDQKTVRQQHEPQEIDEPNAAVVQTDSEHEMVTEAHHAKRGRKRTSDGIVKPGPSPDTHKDKITPASKSRDADEEESASGGVEALDLHPRKRTLHAQETVTRTSVDQAASCVRKPKLWVAENEVQLDNSTKAMAVPRSSEEAGKHELTATQHDGHQSMQRAARRASSSPQASDAENQPPSSRPSVDGNTTLAVGRGVAVVVPLAVNTPTATPSKQGNGGLVGVHAWPGVDLDSIFLASPSSGQTKAASQALSAAERQMTVEEWIGWNAHEAEEGLRHECERLVGLFEREGMEALQSLEAVGCAS